MGLFFFYTVYSNQKVSLLIKSESENCLGARLCTFQIKMTFFNHYMGGHFFFQTKQNIL